MATDDPPSRISRASAERRVSHSAGDRVGCLPSWSRSQHRSFSAAAATMLRMRSGSAGLGRGEMTRGGWERRRRAPPLGHPFGGGAPASAAMSVVPGGLLRALQGGRKVRRLVGLGSPDLIAREPAGIAQVRRNEVHVAEVRAAEVGLAEIRPLEVRLAEVSLTEV